MCVSVYIMRREQPTFSFTFYCSEVAALHMARPLMTERLRRPRPKHLAVLYTSPPHRQPITTSLWVVEGGAPVEHCPVHCAHAHTHKHTHIRAVPLKHTHTQWNIQVTSQQGDDITRSDQNILKSFLALDLGWDNNIWNGF